MARSAFFSKRRNVTRDQLERPVNGSFRLAILETFENFTNTPDQFSLTFSNENLLQLEDPALRFLTSLGFSQPPAPDHRGCTGASAGSENLHRHDPAYAGSSLLNRIMILEN